MVNFAPALGSTDFSGSFSSSSGYISPDKRIINYYTGTPSPINEIEGVKFRTLKDVRDWVVVKLLQLGYDVDKKLTTASEEKLEKAVIDLKRHRDLKYQTFTFLDFLQGPMTLGIGWGIEKLIYDKEFTWGSDDASFSKEFIIELSTSARRFAEIRQIDSSFSVSNPADRNKIYEILTLQDRVEKGLADLEIAAFNSNLMLLIDSAQAIKKAYQALDSRFRKKEWNSQNTLDNVEEIIKNLDKYLLAKQTIKNLNSIGREVQTARDNLFDSVETLMAGLGSYEQAIGNNPETISALKNRFPEIFKQIIERQKTRDEIEKKVRAARRKLSASIKALSASYSANDIERIRVLKKALEAEIDILFQAKGIDPREIPARIAADEGQPGTIDDADGVKDAEEKIKQLCVELDQSIAEAIAESEALIPNSNDSDKINAAIGKLTKALKARYPNESERNQIMESEPIKGIFEAAIFATQTIADKADLSEEELRIEKEKREVLKKAADEARAALADAVKAIDLNNTVFDKVAAIKTVKQCMDNYIVALVEERGRPKDITDIINDAEVKKAEQIIYNLLLLLATALIEMLKSSNATKKQKTKVFETLLTAYLNVVSAKDPSRISPLGYRVKNLMKIFRELNASDMLLQKEEAWIDIIGFANRRMSDKNAIKAYIFYWRVFESKFTSNAIRLVTDNGILDLIRTNPDKFAEYLTQEKYAEFIAKLNTIFQDVDKRKKIIAAIEAGKVDEVLVIIRQAYSS